MTTPAEIIARLDDALARRGEDMFLRKTNTATGQITVKGRIRSYKPDEIEGIIVQGDSKVIISPTGLGAFGVPPPNGYVVVAGTPRRIISANAIRDGGTLVRIDMQVRG